MGNGYPYSKEYFLDMRKAALGKLETAWADTVDKMSEVHLGGSSGSEAVRQARLNASDAEEKSKKRKIGTK